jgi:hypothetical protein
MPPPAIPSVEQVGESIIAEACNLMDHWEANRGTAGQDSPVVFIGISTFDRSVLTKVAS